MIGDLLHSLQSCCRTALRINACSVIQRSAMPQLEGVQARQVQHAAVQVPVLRDALLKQGNWQQIANQQQGTFFSRASSTQQSKSQMDEMLKALDFMCNLQPDKPQAPVSPSFSE